MYDMTIGLEIHVELKTKSKIFCSCPNEFGSEPNKNVCPGCSGSPGALPVLNRQALEHIVKAGLALNCEISKYSKWERKNYFYPDLPAAWQTSQLELPICLGGRVDFEVNGEKKSVRLNHIHLEEDAGKLVHEGGVTKVDYNRVGVPLMEIVTEPDIHSADDAIAFLEEIKSIIKYTGVSDVKMQEGSLRCDVNLSIAPKGSKTLGTRTETKNLNSFSAVRRAIAYEYDRQCDALANGEKLIQETRRWDDVRGEGSGMRSKETAADYRYFTEPNVLPVVLSQKEVADIKASIPPLKAERIDTYINKLGLPEYDAKILTADKAVADLFDATVAKFTKAKKVSNYIMSEIMRKAKVDGSEDLSLGINASQLTSILNLVEDGVISLVASKDVLDAIWGNDNDPEKIVEKLGLKQNNDSSEIEEIVKQIIDANPKVVEDYRGGNAKAMAFFVGQVMKATKGKSNPKVVNEVLVKLLG